MAKPLRGLIQDVSYPSEFIDFYTFEDPTKNRNVNYEDVAIRGRSEPHVYYANTDAAVYSLNISFIASLDEGDNGNPQTVREKENFLESLCMPDYGRVPGKPASVVRPPHLARIRIKRMFDVIGTIRGLNFTYVGPFDIDTGYPYKIDASFSIHAQRVFGREKPLGYAELRRLSARGQDPRTY
jgi:hypothetical protein